MRNMEKSFSKMGFTLIELLIVIALLGALAVGMLAAIDPLEQFKKGNDTSTRNTVEELYNGFVRYYALKTEFPWGATSFDQTTAYDASGFVQSVIDVGELKSDFNELAGSARLTDITIVSTSATGENVAVCFAPESKSFRQDGNTRYDISGNAYTDPETECLGYTTGGATCYWCVK